MKESSEANFRKQKERRCCWDICTEVFFFDNFLSIKNNTTFSFFKLLCTGSVKVHEIRGEELMFGESYDHEEAKCVLQIQASFLKVRPFPKIPEHFSVKKSVQKPSLSLKNSVLNDFSNVSRLYSILVPMSCMTFLDCSKMLFLRPFFRNDT